MYDKKMYDGVFNFSLTETQLNIPQDKVKYDTIDSFAKYYDIKLILRAIDMYQHGIITDKHFAHWCCIYDWIIMGGFAQKALGSGIRWLLIWNISDILDGLSFTADEDELYDGDKSSVEYCREELVALDEVLSNIDMYQFEHTATSSINGIIDVLATNQQEKKFLLFGSELHLVKKIKTMHKCQSTKLLQNKIDQLVSAGYTALGNNLTVSCYRD